MAELDPSQSGAASLVYSSYLGGSNTVASGQGIAVDGAGNAYVTGYTGGPFPTTPGSFQPRDPSSGGHPPLEAFVTKIDPPAGVKSPVSSASAEGSTAVTSSGSQAAVDVLATNGSLSPSPFNHSSSASRLAVARKATDAVFANWGDW